MLQCQDPPLGSEHMERRQVHLVVEAGEEVRGCGSKRRCEGLGGPKSDQLPLKVYV